MNGGLLLNEGLEQTVFLNWNFAEHHYATSVLKVFVDNLIPRK